MNASVTAPQGTLSPIPSLDQTYGALLLGTFCGLILFGLSLHQLYRYVRLYPTDTLFIRALVVGTMLLETAHTVVSMHLCYFYLVSNYLKPDTLVHGIWSLHLIPLFAGMIMIVAQIFFARRLYLVGREYKYVVLIAAIFLAGEFGFAAVTTVKTFIGPAFSDFVRWTWMVKTTFALAMVADSLLSGALIVIIRRSRVSYQGNDTWLDTFTLYAINTGLVTGIFNFISLICAATPSLEQGFVYAAFNIITARLYANTFLTVLNSRKFMVSRGVQFFEKVPVGFGHDVFTRTNRLITAEQWNVPQLPDEAPPMLRIAVTTERQGDGEHDDDGATSERDSTYDKPIELAARRQ